MKIIPKLILLLTKIEEKRIATVGGEKPKSIYCHRDNKGRVIGLIFRNEDEKFSGLIICPNDTDGDGDCHICHKSGGCFVMHCRP